MCDGIRMLQLCVVEFQDRNNMWLASLAISGNSTDL